VRGIALTLEAFQDDPPAFFILENVPRIQQRGRELLDDIVAVLKCHGYEVAETVHDCGVIGGLGQTRKRFLLVARHRAKVPPFVYVPPSLGLKTVGDVLGELPMPDAPGLAMHRCPRLQWKTWLRLALIPAGKDWRALQDLRVVDGHLADIGLAPLAEWHNEVLGVRRWDEPSGTIAGRSTVSNGTYAVADPCPSDGRFNNVCRVVRFDETSPTVTGGASPTAGGLAVGDVRFGEKTGQYSQYGVLPWLDTSGTVTGQAAPGAGTFAVADPRPPESRRNGAMGVRAWGEPCGTVAGETHPSNGSFAVADPRCTTSHGGKGKYRVTARDEHAGAVIAESHTGNGAFAVADPVPAAWRGGRDHFASGGHYGVVRLDEACGAVVGHAKHDTGPWSVAAQLPAMDERPTSTPLIISLDGTWHRPFTTLELGALQGFPWQALGYGGGLDGEADALHRERFGNAVPPPSATAMAGVIGRAFIAARSGITFELSLEPVWVQPLASAISMPAGLA
jgi:site-specific DNA-cytosine methylase